MRVNNLNKTNQNFTNISKSSKPLGAFYNSNATIPTLIIEAGVTLGRTRQAYKRGGKVEASERLCEQGVSAVVWIYGVQILKKIGEKLGSFLGFNNFDFDIGFDELRNPIKNNLNKKINKDAAVFKMVNLLSATAIATYFIGFILPKINHKISNFIIKKDNNNKADEKAKTLKTPTFEQYRKQTQKQKQLSFTSSVLNSLSHTIENNSALRLLITDTGVISGRYKNARNKYEKIEGLFRDISSIYFYLLSTKHIVKLLNSKFLFNNIDINPKTLEKTVEELSKNINDAISKEEFKESIKDNINKEDEEKLTDLFKDKKIIKLEEFCAIFKDKKDKAIAMSNLQPVFDEKRFLSYVQARDVLSSSKLSDPEFLKDAANKITNGKSDNPLKFVSMKYLDEQRKAMDDFANLLVSKVKGATISKEDIEKIAKSTLNKNFAFYCLGTAISTFALGILIPKIQYFITKKLTNQNKFPGLEEYK